MTCPWSPGQTVAEWLLPRVLELVYTAWDLAPFARDLGHASPPFTLNEDRRAHLRADLDAFYARAYGLRWEIPSPDNDRLCRLFHDFCESNNLMHDNDQIFACLHAFPDPPSGQLSLFD